MVTTSTFVGVPVINPDEDILISQVYSQPQGQRLINVTYISVTRSELITKPTSGLCLLRREVKDWRIVYILNVYSDRLRNACSFFKELLLQTHNANVRLQWCTMNFSGCGIEGQPLRKPETEIIAIIASSSIAIIMWNKTIFLDISFR